MEIGSSDQVMSMRYRVSPQELILLHTKISLAGVPCIILWIRNKYSTVTFFVCLGFESSFIGNHLELSSKPFPRTFIASLCPVKQQVSQAGPWRSPVVRVSGL